MNIEDNILALAKQEFPRMTWRKVVRGPEDVAILGDVTKNEFVEMWVKNKENPHCMGRAVFYIREPYAQGTAIARFDVADTNNPESWVDAVLMALGIAVLSLSNTLQRLRRAKGDI